MRRLWPALLALVASPAFAQERDYCPDRPSLGTSACIVDRGHVSVESAAIDWTLDRQPDSRTDTLLIGRTMVRVGATDTIEARVGWTPYGHERTRDLESGAVERLARVGDVSFAIKASLAHPDGKGLAVAVLPYVTLPVGRAPIGGGGALGAGLLLPLSYDLSDTVQLVATPSIAARPNEDGPGRHGRYSTTGGATVKLTEAVSVSAEAQVIRDDEPGDRTTQALGALSIAWQPQDDWQLDLFGVAGLNRDAPDVELAMGVSRRF